MSDNPAPPQDISVSGANEQPKLASQLLLALAIFCLGGLAGYLAGSNQVSLPKVNQPKEVACTLEALICPDGSSVGRIPPTCDFAPCPSVQVVPTPTANLNTTNWTKYTTKDNKYMFSYPSDWQLKDDSKEVDLYNDGNKQWSQNITISKGAYKFTSYNPLAWGPGLCIFPDSADYKKDDIHGVKYASYVEFTGNDNVYRRAQSEATSNNENIYWSICRQEKNSNAFSTVAGFGNTRYESPKNYDENILKTIDAILSSFKILS